MSKIKVYNVSQLERLGLLDYASEHLPNAVVQDASRLYFATTPEFEQQVASINQLRQQTGQRPIRPSLRWAWTPQ